MPEIAALSVTVGYDDSAVQSGAPRTTQTINSLGSQLSSIGTIAGGVLTAGFVAAGAGLATTVKTAADFEKQMSAVGAVAGASATEMEALTKAALQLGKDTSFSASEAATGIEELVKAGVSIQDVLGGGARAALDLAAAGAISVGDAAEIASNALNVFGLKGADMAHVADVIAGAANASAIGVNDYKFSLSAAGAVAATVGISFESLSQAIAVMGNAGIKGSDAGTSLKTMLLNLQPSTKAQTAEFRKLGLVTAEGANQFFTAEGKAKSFAEIAGVLQKAMAGMTKQQQLASLEILFGADAIRAGAVLLEAGTEGFNDMAAAMGKVTAQAVAEERLNNLWGSVEKLKGSLETGAIMLGDLFTPAIKAFVDQITTGVNQGIEVIERLPAAWGDVVSIFQNQSTTGAFEELLSNLGLTETAVVAVDEVVATLGDTFQAVSAFLTGTLGPAIQTVGQFFAEHTEFVTGFVVALGSILVMAAVQAVLAGIAAAIALLLSPIGLVTAAITLLVAAWVGNWGGIRDAVLQAWAAIEPTFTALVDWLGVQIPLVIDFLATTAWPALVTAGQAVGQFITSVLIPAFTQVVLWLGENIPPVVTWMSETGWPALVAAGEAVATFVTGTLIPGFTLLVDWLGPKLQPVVEWISGTGWPALVTAGEAVYAMVQQVITFFQALYVELEKRGVFTELGTIWDQLVGIGQKVWDILTKLAAALAPVFEWVSKLIAEATGLPALVGFLGALATTAGAAGPPVTVVAGAIESMAKAATGALGILDRMLATLQKLSEIKITLPSFGTPGGADTSGFGAQTLSYTGGAGVDQKLSRAHQIALMKGYSQDQANALLGSLRQEGGLTGAVGDSGKSFGPLQFHVGGELPNFARWAKVSIEEAKTLANDLDMAISFALDTYYGQKLKEGTARGLSGPALATYAQQYAQVSIQPEKAGSLYGPPAGTAPTSSVNGINKIPLSGMPGATPDQWPGFMQQTWEQLPAYLQSLDTIQQAGTQTFTAVGTVGTEQGAALVSSSTDSLGNVTTIYQTAAGVIGATITDAAGVIVNQWGVAGTGAVTAAQTMATGVTAETATMAAGVTANTNLMASGALTSVTALGTGTLTTVQTMSGTTIATVTDMQGQVTSQYATLANGAQLSMDGLSAGVLTSTTDLGTGVMTTVQDMSGNYITTITDLSGNVTSQYVQLAADVTAAATEQTAGVTEQTATMAETVLTSVTDMGDGIITITQDANGQMVATITDAAGKVTSQYTTMSSQSGGAVTQMAATTTQQFGNVGHAMDSVKGPISAYTSGVASIKPPNLSSTVTQWNSVASAINKATSALDKYADKGGGGGGSSKEFAKRAVGGPVDFGQAYLVGERGPELFTPSSSGVILPNSALSSGGGGGGRYDTLEIQIRTGDGEAERIYITGRNIAIRRGDALAGTN